MTNQETIEQYLNNTMNVESLNLFKKQLNEDIELAKTVFFQKMLQETAQQYAQAQTAMNAIAAIQRQRTDSKNRVYTLDELTALFAPSEYYESEILITRSTNTNNVQSIIIAAPEPDADCADKLTFVFQQALPQSISLSIENNHEDIVIPDQTIDKKTTSIDIDITTLLPGCYYWKLDTGTDVIVQRFYIDKKLMPNLSIPI